MKDMIKSPEISGNMVKKKGYSPVKAVVYGLLISVVLASLASLIESIIYVILTGSAHGDESGSVAALSNSSIFLTINISLYFSIMYYAGTIVKKYASPKEVKFGAIVSALTCIIYIFLFWASNSFSEFPIWYNTAVFLAIVSALNFGARSPR